MSENTEEPTIDDTMEKIYDDIQERDAEKDDTPEDSPEEGDTPAEASQEEAPEPEQAAEESEAEDQPDPDTPAEEASEEAPEPEPVAAPEYWSEESRQKFDALPEEAKHLVLEQAKNSQADFTRKAQELAEHRKATAPLKGVLDQWGPYLQQRGATPEQAFNALMQAEYVLRTGTPAQKRQALAQLQADYGISDEGAEDEYSDPELASLKGMIENLQSKVDQSQFAQTNAQLAAATQTVERFKAETDDKGQPTHPYFDDVEGTMTALIESGEAKDLQQAYDMAVYTKPETREKLVNAQIAKAKAEVEAKARNEKAKKAAAVNVASSSPPGGGRKPQGAWDDPGAMEEIYDSLQ